MHALEAGSRVGLIRHFGQRDTPLHHHRLHGRKSPARLGLQGKKKPQRSWGFFVRV